MNCNKCKHEMICKYKDEYIRVMEKSNSEEFKGIFDISCNEYLEENKLSHATQKVCWGCSVGDHVYITLKSGKVFGGEISSIDSRFIIIKTRDNKVTISMDHIKYMKYIMNDGIR